MNREQRLDMTLCIFKENIAGIDFTRIQALLSPAFGDISNVRLMMEEREMIMVILKKEDFLIEYREGITYFRITQSGLDFLKDGGYVWAKRLKFIKEWVSVASLIISFLALIISILSYYSKGAK